MMTKVVTWFHRHGARCAMTTAMRASYAGIGDSVVLPRSDRDNFCGASRIGDKGGNLVPLPWCALRTDHSHARQMCWNRRFRGPSAIRQSCHFSRLHEEMTGCQWQLQHKECDSSCSEAPPSCTAGTTDGWWAALERMKHLSGALIMDDGQYLTG